MSNEADTAPVGDETKVELNEEVEEVVEETPQPEEEAEEAPAEEEPVEEVDEIQSEDDMVAQAMRENEELKKQLEELKNSQTNVFEQNEALKAELENQEKLAKVAEENAQLQAQLDGIKRKSLIESLVAKGSLNNDLREWAEALPFESLQEFAKHAPKAKTILDQKNEGTEPDKEMEEWKKEQNRSRIL